MTALREPHPEDLFKHKFAPTTTNKETGNRNPIESSIFTVYEEYVQLKNKCKRSSRMLTLWSRCRKISSFWGEAGNTETFGDERWF